MKVDPTRLTLRWLTYMHEGHEADAFNLRALLAGVFNRLGDGKGSPLKIEPPAWITRRSVATSREEISLARDAFKAYVARQRGDAGGGGA